MRPAAATGGAGAAVVRGGARAPRRHGGGDRAAGALRAQVAERRAARGRQGRGHPARDRRAGRAAAGAGHRHRGEPRRRAGGRRRSSRARCRRRACAAPPGSRSGRRTSSTCWRRRSQAWEERLADEGFAPLRAAWLARAARLGEEITARLPDRAITGRFETIDASGALVLATAGGRVVLPAAEIHFAGRRRRRMLLAIDVGNTNAVFAVHDGQRVVGEWRCRTERQRTADEYFVWLRQLMDFGGDRGRDRLGGGLLGGAAGAVQPARARRPLLPHPGEGGRPARRAAAGGAAGRPRRAGRRRPAGQHRRAPTTATAAT